MASNEKEEKGVYHEKKKKALYHEKQSLQRCALHTLNNLFQRKEFQKADLDVIAYELSPGSFVCPHKSMFGTGNYDVNVLMAALMTRHMVTKWWDRRNDPAEMEMEGLFGLIVNRRTLTLFGLWESKHWFAIVNVDGEFYDLNSNLTEPRKFDSKEEMIVFMRKELERGGEIIRVYHEQKEGGEQKENQQNGNIAQNGRVEGDKNEQKEQ